MSDYAIAIYIRLSLEDSQTDSMSIQNQRLYLLEHAMKLPEYTGAEIMEFTDNGFSGTNFERPAVQRLLDLVREGRIDCILVKDFSRFGRNSIETGYFIERVFPVFHTRFISVGDGFDSADFVGDTGGINVAIKYLINECYSRDMSAKTKAAKYIKFKNGEYQSKICPYGYRKSADGRMEPDPETAPVVQRIFSWAAEGLNAPAIARELYSLGIPTPGEYKARKGPVSFDVSRTNGAWSPSTILRMLEDERYIGTYVIGKRAVTEIGGSHCRLRDRSEWHVIPDHHTAIVEKAVFDTVQEIYPRFSIPKKNKRDYLLRGKVYCGLCDHAMALANGRFFVCRQVHSIPDSPCRTQRVRSDELENMVYLAIKKHIEVLLGVDISDVKARAKEKTFMQANCDVQIALINEKKAQLFEKHMRGEIRDDDFQAENAKYDAELVGIRNTRSIVAAQAMEAQDKVDMHGKNRAVLLEVSRAQSLTQRLVDVLVDRVILMPDNRVELVYKLGNDYAG